TWIKPVAARWNREADCPAGRWRSERGQRPFNSFERVRQGEPIPHWLKPAVVEIPDRDGRSGMACARLLTQPILLHVLEPFSCALFEQRANPPRNVEHLARSQPSLVNQNLKALPGLFVYVTEPQVWVGPTSLAPMFHLHRNANSVTKRLDIDLRDRLPAQLLTQTQPNLIPGVLQASVEDPRVL